jgi:predicted methyltransferase
VEGSVTTIELLLLAVFHHRIIEPDSESGLSFLARIVGGDVTKDALREAVADALADGLVHDPVRLPPGALQCHWYLELAPPGVAAVQRILCGDGSGVVSIHG